jgi:hypothetical protein
MFDSILSWKDLWVYATCKDFICLLWALLPDQRDKLCSYYINKTKKPKNRASIRLAVKIGSIVEEEDERGVAHIVEHLAFSATSVRLDGHALKQSHRIVCLCGWQSRPSLIHLRNARTSC